MKQLSIFRSGRLAPSAVIAMISGILIAAALGCGGSAKPAPPDYVGSWTGDDQSTLTIRADGSADFKSGNTSVSGGTADIDEAAKTLKITFMRIGPSFTIDKPPLGGRMTLSGVLYSKASFAAADATRSPAGNSNSNAPDTSAEVPSDKAVADLVHSSIADLAKAVDTGDFSDLYENASSDFRSTYTIEQVQQQFSSYVQKKDVIGPILKQADGLEADFSPKVATRTEKGVRILVADGLFDTTPQKLHFETEYVERAGEWKMLTLVLNVK